jgi:hypothetical protein
VCNSFSKFTDQNVALLKESTILCNILGLDTAKGGRGGERVKVRVSVWVGRLVGGGIDRKEKMVAEDRYKDRKKMSFKYLAIIQWLGGFVGEGFCGRPDTKERCVAKRAGLKGLQALCGLLGWRSEGGQQQSKSAQKHLCALRGHECPALTSRIRPNQKREKRAFLRFGQ